MNPDPLSVLQKMDVYKQEGRTGGYQSSLWALAAANAKASPVSVGWGNFFIFLKENYLGILWDESCFDAVASEVYQVAHAGALHSWISNWRSIDEELTAEARTFVEYDVASKTLEDLRKKYDTMFALNQRLWRDLIFIDTFDAGFDQRTMRTIAEADGIDDSELQTVVTPTMPSFVTEWDVALKECAAGTISREDLKQRFFWYATDYFNWGEMTDVFIEKALSVRHDGEFISPETQQSQILSKHGLQTNPFEFFQLLTMWRDIRKRMNYTSLYALLKILREVLRRQHIDPQLANGIIPHQVDDLFSGKLTRQTLEEQFYAGTLLWATPAGEFIEYRGSEAQKIWDALLLASENKNEGGELKGSPASRGKAQGRVRVVLDITHASAAQMLPGEILVTSMTRPEFLPLMRIAGAIITNEGGITSHAAIVSRELKKPCIIGTRNATSVLKDGDMVEVDAEQGIVRRL